MTEAPCFLMPTMTAIPTCTSPAQGPEEAGKPQCTDFTTTTVGEISPCPPVRYLKSAHRHPARQAPTLTTTAIPTFSLAAGSSKANTPLLPGAMCCAMTVAYSPTSPANLTPTSAKAEWYPQPYGPTSTMMESQTLL